VQHLSEYVLMTNVYQKYYGQQVLAAVYSTILY